MINFIRQDADYNQWANGVMGQWIGQITEDQSRQELVSSFPSVNKTLQHIWLSQWIWVSRLEGSPFDPAQAKREGITREDLMKGILDTGSQFQTFCNALQEENLADPVSYKNLKGEPYTNSLYQVLTHVFNHSAFHRGQVVTLLRQVGFTGLSSTDMITYYRLQNAAAR